MKLTGLWRSPDFLKLWSAQTVSVFGTLMGALQFTAVLVLEATPLQMAVLTASGVLPGLLFSLLAGAWVDRMARRPLLIAADLGRALLIGSVPAAYVLDMLGMEQLYAVSFLTGALSVVFDVARQAYVPALVSREELVEANSKLAGGESVVEVVAFSGGGWIAQLFSAIIAAAIDALTFVCSALLIWSIRRPEPARQPDGSNRALGREVLEGLGAVWRRPLLRSLAVATAAHSLGGGMIGAVILLFGVDELAVPPGVLTTIFALGGISSVAGSMLAGKITKWMGVGRAVVAGLMLYGLSTLFIPLAQGPIPLILAFLATQQLLGDGPWTVYEIGGASLRQGATPPHLLGRVNSATVMFVHGTRLFGSLLAGIIGQWYGLRAVLFIATSAILAGGVWLALSAVRNIREVADIIDG